MNKLDEVYDRKWEMQFFELKKFKKKYGHCDVPQHRNKLYAKLSRWCGSQRRWKKFRPLEYDPDRIRKLDLIGFSWNIPDKWFEKNLKKLQAYIFLHGHSCVFPSYDKSLHKWCTHLREDKKNKEEKLTFERIKRLEAIGFDWEPDENFYEKLHFEERLAQFKEFVLKHNRYPSGNDDKYPFLSTWVERQRHDSRYGVLSKERIKKLNEFNFRWEPHKENWENYFEKLKLFKMEFGHCNISQNQPNKKYYGLASWCIRQRKSYKEKNKSLTDMQIQKLNDIGFNWVHPFKQGEVVRNKTSNEMLLNELKRLHKKLGRAPLYEDLKKHSKYTKGKYMLRFGSYRNALLQAGLQNTDEEFWINNYNELKIFFKKYGHYPPRTGTQFESLVFWILNQRQLKRKGKLSDERIKLLDAIKFSWNPFNDSWETNFEKLKGYKKEFGHCNVPENPGLYQKLGAWVGTQRRHYSRLTPYKIEKLNGLGFSWESAYKSK